MLTKCGISSGVHIEKRVFSKVGKVRRVVSPVFEPTTGERRTSGQVEPSPLGYCSVMKTGISNSGERERGEEGEAKYEGK